MKITLIVLWMVGWIAIFITLLWFTTVLGELFVPASETNWEPQMAWAAQFWWVALAIPLIMLHNHPKVKPSADKIIEAIDNIGD